MTLPELLERVEKGLRSGQALENQSPPNFAAALACYDELISQLRAAPTVESVVHALGITLMNRGNVLQKQAAPEVRAAAVAAYDEAISLFHHLPFNEHAGIRNSLAAAWMNRGHARLAVSDANGMRDALQSFRQAIALLRDLPLDQSRSYRVNFAAAQMNESNALVALGEFAPALTSAQAALAITAVGEKEDPVLADIGLKARRVATEAVNRLRYAASQRGESTEELGDLGSDIVDEGLALSRSWETRGHQEFRYIAARLFQSGADLYATHLPDFLAEFLLEHIDPDISPGAMAESTDLYVVAEDAIGGALQDLERRRDVFVDDASTARLIERRRSLKSASARLAELRARFVREP
jgi:tetratricopeptide (TPR) repeat protein